MKKLIGILSCLAAFASLGDDGSGVCTGPGSQGGAAGTGTTAQSCDPNEISGPLGVGEARYVAPGEWMDYTIYFENKTNATAAAQEVFVDLPMDENLDWTTLELGEVVFGDHIDMSLSGKSPAKKASLKASYAMPGTNTLVKTEVTAKNGVLSWYIRDWDPTTTDNFPKSATGGFLPPNNADENSPDFGCGEGRVSYRVKVRDDAPQGAVINASATIVFDDNAAITTDPSWFNTVATIYEPTLDLGDGTTTNLTLVVGQPYGELPEPAAREGQTFVGWFTGENGTGRQVTAESIVEEGDTALYAYWTQDVVPLPVFRFYSKAYKGHFFTISEEEKDELIAHNPNWKFEGTAYRAYTNEASRTVALYRFYSKGYRGHFFTIDADEAETVKTNPNWKYEGIAYYVYPSAVEGSVPVFRFWSKGYRHHFYTTDEAEKDNLIATNPNWKYEGEAFWALPAEEARSAAKAAAMSNDRNDGNNDGNDEIAINAINAISAISAISATSAINGDANGFSSSICASPEVGGGIAPWALATWPDCAPVALEGVTAVGGLVVETRTDAPELEDLPGGDGSTSRPLALPLLLSLPDGAWRATLRSAVGGNIADEDATGVFGFTLPANGLWHWLRVRDTGDDAADTDADAFSLWLRAK